MIGVANATNTDPHSGVEAYLSTRFAVSHLATGLGGWGGGGAGAGLSSTEQSAC